MLAPDRLSPCPTLQGLASAKTTLQVTLQQGQGQGQAKQSATILLIRVTHTRPDMPTPTYSTHTYNGNSISNGMRHSTHTPPLMTDTPSFHDNYPVSCRQVLHLVSRQDTCPVAE